MHASTRRGVGKSSLHSANSRRGRNIEKATPPLHSEIAQPKANLDALVEKIANRPGMLSDVFAGLHADEAKVKYRCLKLLRLLSEQHPALLYPEFNRFADLLDSDNTILKWGALIILGNLASVDSENRLEPLLDRYLQPIAGPVMITAANTIGGAARIAVAKPHLTDRIVQAMFQVEAAKYQTAECRNVALGHVLKAFAMIHERIRNDQRVLEFVRRQLRNRRNAVKLKARAFLKQQEKLSSLLSVCHTG